MKRQLFTLNIGDVKIKKLEQLKENFEIEEVIEIYESGKLEKWLYGRKYDEEVEKLKNLKDKYKISEVFDIEIDEDIIEYIKNSNQKQNNSTPKQKTLKFKLILNNQKIYSLEDLQNNFVLDEICEYYKNGLLQLWIKNNGYEKLYQKIKNINSNKPIYQLVEIFEIGISKKELDNILENQNQNVNLSKENREIENLKKYIVTFSNKIKELEKKINNQKDYSDIIIDTLYNTPKTDFDTIKQLVNQIIIPYFQKDVTNFFNKFDNYNPLVIFAILMNEKLNKILLSNISPEKLYFYHLNTAEKRNKFYKLFNINNYERYIFNTKIGLKILLEKKTLYFRNKTLVLWDNDYQKIQIVSNKQMYASPTNPLIYFEI